MQDYQGPNFDLRENYKYMVLQPGPKMQSDLYESNGLSKDFLIDS